MKKFSTHLMSEGTELNFDVPVPMGVRGDDILRFITSSDVSNFDSTKDEYKFLHGLFDYYDGSTSPNSEAAWRFLRKTKNKYPAELKPDYSYIYRGRGKEVRNIKNLGISSWKLMKMHNTEWMVGKGSYKVRNSAVSSWTYDELSAWQFSKIGIGLANDMSGAVRKMEEHAAFVAGVSRPSQEVLALPYIMRKRADINTVLSSRMATRLSDFYGYPDEKEVVQVGTGPYAVEYILHKSIWDVMQQIQGTI